MEIWESVYNPGFNYGEFTTIKSTSEKNINYRMLLDSRDKLFFVPMSGINIATKYWLCKSNPSINKALSSLLVFLKEARRCSVLCNAVMRMQNTNTSVYKLLKFVADMRRLFQQRFTTVTLFGLNLFLTNCNSHSTNTKEKIDSIRTGPLKERTDSILLSRGKALFSANCNSCHPIFKTDNFLARIVDRVGAKYLKLYITKQDSLIEAKDQYALKLKDVFGNLGNSHNFVFSEEQLNAIIAYLDKYSP